MSDLPGNQEGGHHEVRQARTALPVKAVLRGDRGTRLLSASHTLRQSLFAGPERTFLSLARAPTRKTAVHRLPDVFHCIIHFPLQGKHATQLALYSSHTTGS